MLKIFVCVILVFLDGVFWTLSITRGPGWWNVALMLTFICALWLAIRTWRARRRKP